MELFDENLKNEFESRGQTEILHNLSETYEELLKRTVPRIDYPDNAKTFTKKRVEFNCKTCQHVLLHRVIHLLKGAFGALSQHNVYAMALCIRGHFESTASIGYLHHQITSFLNGSIELSNFDECVCNQFLGCRHKSLSRAPDPKNIMTQLDYADKVVDRQLFKGHTNESKILRDCYEYLSEFAHPNFHSNSVAFRPNTVTEGYIFRYDNIIRDEEFSLIGYLNISNPIFIWLFDKFSESLTKFWE
jgi:hypothetical protein